MQGVITLVFGSMDSVAHVTALVLLTGVTHVGVLVGTVSLLGGAPALYVSGNTGI